MPGQAESTNRRQALLIATSEYSDPALRPLGAPGRDVDDLEDVLSHPEIGGFAVQKRVNTEHGELQIAIVDFCADQRPGDLLLIYLSCHGVLDDSGRLYYAATDTVGRRIAATAVAATWLNERLDDCRARSQVIILDCCHSGAFAGPKGSPDLALEERFRPRGHGGRGRIVLTASGGSEYSFEGDHPSGVGVQSVYTRILAEGLRTGEADRDGDGRITVSDIGPYLHDKVVDAEPRQTPEYWIYGGVGDVLLAYSVRGAVLKPAPLPEDLRVQTESPRRGIRQTVIDELAERDQREQDDAKIPRQPRDDSGQKASPESRRARRIMRRAIVALSASLATIALVIAGIMAFHKVGPPTTAVRWSYPVKGPINTRPTVADGTVYFGSDDGKVYALDADTGNLRWSYPTTAGPVDSSPAGPVDSSPAVADGTVYFGGGDSTVYALDADTGNLRWSYPTKGPVDSSPAVADGTVYFGSDDRDPRSGDAKVYALDADTGNLRWSYLTKESVNSSPAVADGTVYIGSDNDTVYALNATTGHLRWSYQSRAPVRSSPAVADGTVYIGSDDGTVYALNATTGQPRWSYPTGADVVPGPAVADGTVYIGSDNDTVYALNATTGHLRWSYQTRGPVNSSPAVADGTVYIGSNDDTVYALNATTGHLRWSYPTGGIFFSSPAAAGGTVYIGSDDNDDNEMYALSAGP